MAMRMQPVPLRSAAACVGAVMIMLLAAVPAHAADPAQSVEALLDQVIAGSQRSEKNRARDQYRHPKETLLFFGLKPDMTVVEIWPAGGWYAEIIAPVVRAGGAYIGAGVAHEDPAIEAWQRQGKQDFIERFTKQPAVFGKVSVTSLKAPEYTDIAPKGSADLVLTFRNVHNWSAAKNDAATFRAFFAALKPGGSLGVVEHRAKPGTPLEQMIKTGYMTEEYVIGLATQAGFRLVAKSEINANPKDSKDHPDGVWSLPPMRRGSFFSGDKYLAIGESDRMTLRFVKP
ncbi:MAG: methyltransferase [Betaproteobacteria bacterium]|nr:methyltransferase [Betaproteobacteria bacterium]